MKSDKNIKKEKEQVFLEEDQTKQENIKNVVFMEEETNIGKKRVMGKDWLQENRKKLKVGKKKLKVREKGGGPRTLMQQQQEVDETREESGAKVVDDNLRAGQSKEDLYIDIHNNPAAKTIIQAALSLDLHFLEPSLEKLLPHIDTASILTAYRKFLAIKTVFGDTGCPQELSPSPLVDQVWHLHLQRPGLYMAACLHQDWSSHRPRPRYSQR